jgi:hypothetical protein
MKRLVSLSVGLAIVLLAGRALASGLGAAAPHVGGPGVAGVALGSISGVGPIGAVTIRGITVLPNGQMIVPAVTPRNLAPAHLDDMQKPMTPIEACPYKRCAP